MSLGTTQGMKMPRLLLDVLTCEKVLAFQSFRSQTEDSTNTWTGMAGKPKLFH